MYSRDRIVAGVLAALSGIPAALMAFGVVSEAQAASLVAIAAAFAAGYRMDRGAAKDALKK
jgi:hypothetical protein